jgi:hypothetical protein
VTTRAGEKKSDWRKERRGAILGASCVGFIAGFFLAYRGGVGASDAMIAASFVVLGVSCALPFIAKK